jgi:hypothetical protein
MRRTLLNVGLISLILGAAVGCNKQVVREKTPPDPLLVSKKPVEGKPHEGEPVHTARLDPPAPPQPAAGTATVAVPWETSPVRSVKLGLEPVPQR